MRLGMVGCGYVADFYLRTLALHPELELVGVFDRAPDRAARTADRHRVRAWASLDEMLEDPRLDAVLNLTNPTSHHAVTRASLEAGLHVYSEKPVDTDLQGARDLVALARRRGRVLASAPCSVLGEAAQTAWRALRDGAIGEVTLAYASLDDGRLRRADYQTWRNEAGEPWPAEDEIRTGCTLEHAAYALSWLVAFLGPATRVAAYSACLSRDQVAIASEIPDFSVGCVEHASGAVARITNSTVADRDHRLILFGERGTLTVENVWRYDSPVTVARPGAAPELVPGPPTPPFGYPAAHGHQMDFARGIAELARAVAEDRPCRLGAEFSLHVAEVTLALQGAGRAGASVRFESPLAPMEPMPWA